MAKPKKPKPKLPKPPKSLKENVLAKRAAQKNMKAATAPKPSDYLRGGTRIGQKYTAWDTYGEGKPDLGKGAGPGDPYHEVTKTVRPPARPPVKAKPPVNRFPTRPRPGFPPNRFPVPGDRPPVKAKPRFGGAGNDFQVQAIQRRLRGLA